jgi:dTDP-4-dehydrorhamnose reductase
VAVVYSGRPGAKSTFATQVVEKLRRGERVNAFSDQVVSPTLAENAAEMTLELLLEHDYQGVLHTAGATALDRVEFAHRVAARFGLTGTIQPVRTSDVKLLAPRPLRCGLRVDRAMALLRARPLDVGAALDRFHDQWMTRTDA